MIDARQSDSDITHDGSGPSNDSIVSPKTGSGAVTQPNADTIAKANTKRRQRCIPPECTRNLGTRDVARTQHGKETLLNNISPACSKLYGRLPDQSALPERHAVVKRKRNRIRSQQPARKDLRTRPTAASDSLARLVHPSSLRPLPHYGISPLVAPIMSDSPLTNALPDDAQKELDDLQAFLAGLPEPSRAQGLSLCQRVVESSRNRRRVLLLIQESLGQLRLDMKYLLFDLDATRRERDELREQLDR